MKKNVLALIFFFLTGLTNNLLAEQFIVKSSQKISFNSLKSLLHPLSEKYIDSIHDKGNLLLLDIDSRDLSLANKKFKELLDSGVFLYVVKNIKIKLGPLEIDDPKSNEQWALEKIGVEKAWEISSGSSDVTVAVIDTGIDWKHEDLVDRIWINEDEIEGDGIDNDNNNYIDDVRGFDFRDNDNDPMDLTSAKNPGHGTHCAGIIAATANNQKGISGVAPGISLMPVRFLGADGSGDLMGAVKAIDYAIDNGADIISASWGAEVSEAQMRPVLEAIERAEAKGVIFVAAAANNGKNNDLTAVYPSNAKTAISVSASQEDDNKPSWSNYGRRKVSLAAPGVKILSTLPDNKYGLLSGTSMATPAVAGLVALLVSHSKTMKQKLTAPQIKAIMQATGEDVNIETACHCRISAAKALEHLDKQVLTIVPFAQTIDPENKIKLEGLFGSGVYKFYSSDSQIASVSDTGEVVGKSPGNFSVMISDDSGLEAVSKNFYVENQRPQAPKCPFQNPQICVILCDYKPELEFCQNIL
jgi:thermitase